MKLGQEQITDEEFAAVGPRHRRRRRVIAGEGMVTPVKLLVLETENGLENLHPGRSRLIVNYPFVRQHPELFRPCDPTDTATRDRMRAYLARAGPGAASHKAEAWRLSADTGAYPPERRRGG
jgi:hypothetical protein